MHGGRVPAGETVRPLSVSSRLHLRQPAESARDRGAEKLGQYQARADHAPQYFLEGRRARRLPESILEICVVAPETRRHRRSDFLGVDRASPDHVRARGVDRPAERLELFDAPARGICPCRVTENENAAVPFAEASAGPYPSARRPWPDGRGHADQGAARIYAGPC